MGLVVVIGVLFKDHIQRMGKVNGSKYQCFWKKEH